MAVMPAEVQELFKSVKNAAFSTATPDAQPNAGIVAMNAVVDDEAVYLSNQFFNKTLASLQVNPKVAIAFWEGNEAYVLHGTVRYVNEGAEFEEQKAWVDAALERMGPPIKAKGGRFASVETVYISAPGPTAGDKIA